MSSGPYWTEAEVEILKNNYPSSKQGELQKLLPRRNWRCIGQKAFKLGIKRNFDAMDYGIPFEGEALGGFTEAEKGYLAGIIDGEGCIGFYRRRNGKQGYYVYAMNVTIANSSPRLERWLGDKFPNRFYRQKQNPTEWTKKEVYRWSLSGSQQVMQFLKEIEPYLVIKRRQAEALQNGYVHLSENERHELYMKMKEYNHTS